MRCINVRCHTITQKPNYHIIVMGKVFTSQEREWIHTVAQDLVRWKADKGSTPDFLTAAARSWWKAFPYRHPRLVDHFSHTAEQRGRTFYGEEFFGHTEVCCRLMLTTNRRAESRSFIKRLRQHLNSSKDKEYKNSKVGTMSHGLCEKLSLTANSPVIARASGANERIGPAT